MLWKTSPDLVDQITAGFAYAARVLPGGRFRGRLFKESCGSWLVVPESLWSLSSRPFTPVCLRGGAFWRGAPWGQDCGTQKQKGRMSPSPCFCKPADIKPGWRSTTKRIGKHCFPPGVRSDVRKRASFQAEDAYPHPGSVSRQLPRGPAVFGENRPFLAVQRRSGPDWSLTRKESIQPESALVKCF